MFSRVFGVHTASGNNQWMRGKLLQGERRVEQPLHSWWRAGPQPRCRCCRPQLPSPSSAPCAALGFDARWCPAGGLEEEEGADAADRRLSARERRAPAQLSQEAEQAQARVPKKKAAAQGWAGASALKRARSDADASPFAAAANAVAAAAGAAGPGQQPYLVVVVPDSAFAQHAGGGTVDLARASSWHDFSRQHSAPAPGPHSLMATQSSGGGRTMEAAALAALKALGWGTSDGPGTQQVCRPPAPVPPGPNHMAAPSAASWQTHASMQHRTMAARQELQLRAAAQYGAFHAQAQVPSYGQWQQHAVMPMAGPGVPPPAYASAPMSLERHYSSPGQLLLHALPPQSAATFGAPAHSACAAPPMQQLPGCQPVQPPLSQMSQAGAPAVTAAPSAIAAAAEQLPSFDEPGSPGRAAAGPVALQRSTSAPVAAPRSARNLADTVSPFAEEAQQPLRAAAAPSQPPAAAAPTLGAPAADGNAGLLSLGAGDWSSMFGGGATFSEDLRTLFAPDGA